MFGLDAKTGEERISFRSPARALTSLRIASDTLYATGLDGGLFAHYITGGTEQFRFAPSLAIAGAPEVVGDTAYVGTIDGDRVYAIDAETGETKWCNRMKAVIWSSPVAVGGIVYVGCADGNDYALDAREGTVRWRVQTGARVWGSPVVTNELVYVSNDDGLVFALYRADGRVRWQFQAQDSLVAPPAVGRDSVYVGDVVGTVYALPQ